MTLLDSNLVIYAAAAGNDWLVAEIESRDCCVSIITAIEVLGFHDLQPHDKSRLETFFASSTIVPVDEDIAEEAIRLRQLRKLGLGDSLHAATALHMGWSLGTRNTRDFNWIPGLKLWNPFDKQPTP